MGLLTNLIEMKSQKDTQAKTNMASALGLILKDEKANPGQKEWALNSIVQLAEGEFGGGKGKGGGKSGGGGGNGMAGGGAGGGAGHPEGVGGFFKSILGGLVHGVGAAADKVNPTTPNSGTKNMMQSIAGSRPAGPTEMSDEEIQKKQNALLEQEAATKRKIARADNQDKYEQEFKRLTDSGMDPKRASEEANAFASGRAAPAQMQPKPETANDIAFDAFREKNKLPPDAPLTGLQKVQAIKEYKASETAEKPDTGQVGQYEHAFKAEHPEWTEAQVKKAAADQYLKDQKQKEQRVQVSINNAQASGAINNQPSSAKTTSYWAGVLARGGTIPYGMMRSMGKRQVADIMNAVPAYAEQNGLSVGDVLANQADVKALAASLRPMETQYGLTKAFEQTATQNLDRAIAAAGKIADTGSPFFNKPWRSVEKDLLGKPEYSAYHAARVTAFTEVSKVLNGSLGNGSVSDSARKEAEASLGENATLEQLKSAADILKQDMQSRTANMETMISETKKKIAETGSGGSTIGISSAPKVKVWNEKTNKFEEQ